MYAEAEMMIVAIMIAAERMYFLFIFQPNLMDGLSIQAYKVLQKTSTAQTKTEPETTKNRT